MAELTYYVAVTLDGWIADPHGDTSAFLTEGDHLAALAVAYPETFPAPYRAALGIDAANQRFDTVVMGRKTYAPALDAGLTSPYPHLRQSVVSRTLSGRTDPAVTVVADDPVEHVRRLKDSSQLGVWLCGGGQLASALAPGDRRAGAEGQPGGDRPGNTLVRRGDLAIALPADVAGTLRQRGRRAAPAPVTTTSEPPHRFLSRPTSLSVIRFGRSGSQIV